MEKPVCTYGRPSPVDPEWTGPDHCAACHADVEQACQQFAADVKAGKYDEDGYTPRERAAAERKRLERGMLW